MYKLRHLTLTGLLCLSACGTPYSAQGSLHFNVAWPASTGFAIQVIPDATREIVLQVFNASGALELEERLEREAGPQKVSVTLSVGTKQLQITARDSSGEILAESRSTVEIEAGKVSQIQSELIPLAVTVNPGSSNAGGGSSNNSSNPSSNEPSDSTPPDSSLPDTAQSPLPESSPSPLITPTPQPTPSSGSRGGSSGSGSGGSSTSDLTLTASPDRLSGMGYATFLSATPPSGDSIESITWSCTPPSGGNACGNFAGDTAETVWKSPRDNNSFGDSTVTSVIFTLTANAVLGSGGSLTENIEITVNRGSGNVAVPSGPPNAGEFDGGN